MNETADLIVDLMADAWDRTCQAGKAGPGHRDAWLAALAAVELIIRADQDRKTREQVAKDINVAVVDVEGSGDEWFGGWCGGMMRAKRIVQTGGATRGKR